MSIEPEKRPRGRPRKVRDTRDQEAWAPSAAPTLPVKPPGAGRRKVRDSISPQAASLLARGALDRHGLHQVLVPAAMTQATAIVTMLQHGLAISEVARTLSASEKMVRNSASKWRQRQGMSLDEWHAIVQGNADARRQQRGVGHGYAASSAPTIAPKAHAEREPTLSDAEAAEVIAFVEDIGAIAVMRELAAQGRSMSRAQVEALPEEVYCRVMWEADVWEARERFHGKGWSPDGPWQSHVHLTRNATTMPVDRKNKSWPIDRCGAS